MYEEKFGTDWETLSHDELVERAFVLGLSESVDELVPGEYDRILAEAETAYSRNIIELAFSEGKEQGNDRQENGPDDVDDAVSEAEADELLRESQFVENGLIPEAVNRIELLDSPGDGLDRIRLPEFLTRD